MKRISFMLVFASGCATAAMAGWITTGLRAQSRAQPNVVHVCAAPEGLLRVTPLRAVCPAGQQSMYFRRSAEPPPADAPDETPKGTADARIKALEQRIAALEGQASRTGLTRRVPAPFEVVDRHDRPVFSVTEEREARLYNAAGDPLVRLGARDAGGFVLADNSAHTLRAHLYADQAESAFQLVEGKGLVRARIGNGTAKDGGSNGKYRLVFYSKDGAKELANIGEYNAGEGAALVGDASSEKAGMDVRDGVGEVGVYNGKHFVVGELTEGKTSGGLFVLSNSAGDRMVEAGVQPEGFGVVKAGPASFMQAAGIGLPGSYIAGKPK